VCSSDLVPKQAAPVQPPEPQPKIAAAPPPPAAPPSPQVSACQDRLNRIVNSGHIHFATDSAILDSTSFETLERLASAAKVCPGMRIAIEGHTDAEGSAEYNQRLSVRRARAVVAFLVKAGADRKQLEAVGYGPTRPAAPNDTEENMAKNRRIEFSVRQQ
jgi:OOP family OmpA-OmpF porin